MNCIEYDRVYWYNIFMNRCLDCGLELKKITAKWCKQHGYKHRQRPSGLKYTLHKDNPTSFRKGIIPWNKGTIGIMEAWNKGIKGSIKPNIGSFTSEITRGDKNSNWAGDKVGYYCLHSWVNRELGKASKCEYCCENQKRIEWANKSHQYKRDINDWLQLCKKCHCKYDKEYWGEATKKYPKLRSKKCQGV